MGEATGWFEASVVGGLVLGFIGLVAARHRPWPLATKLGLATIPAIGVLLAWEEGIAMVVRPMLEGWSGPRLAPAAAMLRGYPLYERPEAGPVSGWIYPPMSALAYLPAAALAVRPGDPVAAILAGRLLSGLFVFGPAAWILFRGAGDARRRVAAALAFGLFAMLASASPSLRYVATEIHADAPALAFGAIALGTLGRFESGGDPGRRRRLGLAAVAAATLAVWSKQLAAPWALLAVIRVAAAEYRARRLRGLARVAAVAMGISLAFGLAFDPVAQAFQLLMVPGRHPLAFARFADFVTVLTHDLRREAGLGALLAGGLAGLAIARWRPAGPGPRRSDDRSLIYLLAGATIAAPLAVLGYAKMGGDVNALAYVTYPLAIAGALAASRAAATSGAATAALIAATAWVGWGEFDRSAADLRGGKSPWIAESRMVTRYLRDHPGAVYFPCHPLEHLAVEGRLLHFEYGIADRRLAGFPPFAGHLLRHVPPASRRMCYPAGRSYAGFEMTRVLGAGRPVAVPELPGCSCFAPGR